MLAKKILVYLLALCGIVLSIKFEYFNIHPRAEKLTHNNPSEKYLKEERAQEIQKYPEKLKKHVREEKHKNGDQLRQQSAQRDNEYLIFNPKTFEEIIIRPHADQLTQQSAHKYHSGKGEDYKDKYYAKKGDKEVEGYVSKHKQDKRKHSKKSKEYDKGESSEEGGNKSNHHDEADKYSKHHASGQSHKGAKFGEKKGHKRGHKTKGYHNKFYKDEYHKEHKFYDNFHKSGDYSKYGAAHSDFENKEGGRKKGAKHNSGYHKDEYGEKDLKSKGYNEKEDKGHDFSEGDDVYHDRERKYGKKGSSSGGKHWGYKNKDRD